MKYVALIQALSDKIEEEVTVEINGVEFTGFTFICPYEISVSNSYPVFLSFTILNELDMRKLDELSSGFERIEDSYAYYVRGVLHENTIDAGVILTDEDGYFDKYGNLVNEYVEMKVDRISVEFLEE